MPIVKKSNNVASALPEGGARKFSVLPVIGLSAYQVPRRFERPDLAVHIQAVAAALSAVRRSYSLSPVSNRNRRAVWICEVTVFASY